MTADVTDRLARSLNALEVCHVHLGNLGDAARSMALRGALVQGWQWMGEGKRINYRLDGVPGSIRISEVMRRAAWILSQENGQAVCDAYAAWVRAHCAANPMVRWQQSLPREQFVAEDALERDLSRALDRAHRRALEPPPGVVLVGDQYALL